MKYLKGKEQNLKTRCDVYREPEKLLKDGRGCDQWTEFW